MEGGTYRHNRGQNCCRHRGHFQPSNVLTTRPMNWEVHWCPLCFTKRELPWLDIWTAALPIEKFQSHKVFVQMTHVSCSPNQRVSIAEDVALDWVVSDVPGNAVGIAHFVIHVTLQIHGHIVWRQRSPPKQIVAVIP